MYLHCVYKVTFYIETRGVHSMSSVQTKFATPILHVINIFLNYGIFFYMYIIIDNIFCILFEIFSHLYFCSNYFSLILRHST